MKTFNYLLVLICTMLVIGGCASRNIMDVRGNNMDFSYGLISVKGLSRIIIARESAWLEKEALPVYTFEPTEQIGNMINAD